MFPVMDIRNLSFLHSPFTISGIFYMSMCLFSLVIHQFIIDRLHSVVELNVIFC